jgi:hypothetical protein
MDHALKIVEEVDRRYGVRRYEIVDGKLKWGYDQGGKFEFLRGQKYKVSYLNPARARHKGAVGIYVGSRRGGDYCRDGSHWVEPWCTAILECMGKKFAVDPAALVPWEGEITEEHLKLISPVKGRVHLIKDNQPACSCSRRSDIGHRTLPMEDFLAIPENSRCKSCNYVAKRLDSK